MILRRFKPQQILNRGLRKHFTASKTMGDIIAHNRIKFDVIVLFPNVTTDPAEIEIRAVAAVVLIF